MTIIRRLVIAAALFGFTASTPVAAEEWSGFYVGVHAGAVDSTTGIRDEDSTVFDEDGTTGFTNDLTGLAGIHIGYNWQFGSTVLGIEADYSRTDAGQARYLDNTGHFISSQIDGFGSIRGRAGVAVNNALIFITGGIGFVNSDVFGFESLPDQIARYENFTAMVAGAGTEFKLAENVSFRGEYLYYHFNDKRDTCNDCDEPQTGNGALHVLRAGVTHHFADGSRPLRRTSSKAWSGFYAGAHVGASDTNTGIADEDSTVFDLDVGTVFTNDLDFAGGLHGGYNLQFGAAVLGVEVDYSWTNSGYTRIFDGTDHFLSSQIDGFGSIRGRMGVASGNALAYVTGGVGYVNADLMGYDSLPNQVVSYSGFRALVAGAGVEAKLTPNMSVRGEYLRYSFDEKSDVCTSCQPQPQLADGAIHSMRLGVTYHINGALAEAFETKGSNWTGLYAGGHIAGVNSRTGIRDEDGTIYDAAGLTVFTTSQDVAGGVHAGYNYQIGSAVFGVELDYAFTNSGEARLFDSTDHFKSSKINGFGSLRGRIGLAAGQSLVYVTGGIGYVNGKVSGYDSVPDQIVTYKNFAALVAGAGTEFKPTDNLAIRAEYLYYGFDEKSDRCNDCSAADPAFADGTLHTLRIGASYHF